MTAQDLLDSFPVTDGFTFCRTLRCDLAFQNLAVQQYEALRRASAFRTKTWLAPKDSTVLIPAFDSFEYQISLVPGSTIWGYSFLADTGEETGSLSFNLRDSCDDTSLFSEVTTRQSQTPPYLQQYLSKLLVVGPPGLLNVEICNTYGTAVTAQLAIYGGEPAK